VHNDDIVVGTHGRSFWILDNITPLRQLKPEVTAAAAHLFTPQLTYRLRRNNNTDTPLPPEEPAGQNPPDGAVIDYWLPSHAAHVFLSIEDSSGKTVRAFSSADRPDPVNEKKFNVPMYWVRPTRTLSGERGMHRFVWDLTYPAPDVLSRDYPISAIYHDTPLYPLGATVLPGNYKLVLRTDSGMSTQPLEIRMDPRVKTSADGLREHFELDRAIANSLHRDYEALQHVRSLRNQLKAIQGKNPSSEIKKTIDAIEAKAAMIEGEEGGYGMRFLSTPEGRTLARLNAGYGTVLSGLDTADAPPTTQQTAMVADLDKALAEQLDAWAQLKSKDVVELNQQLKKAGLPSVEVEAAIAWGGGQISSQDRDRE
jgi:hypothetical protein